MNDFFALSNKEFVFPVSGVRLRSDHAYALYSAISQICPEFHKEGGISIQTIPGELQSFGFIRLTEKSRFRLRVPDSLLSVACRLAGAQLGLNGHSISLGAPTIYSLIPSPVLKSRIVTIRGFTELSPFEEALHRQIQALGLSAKATVPTLPCGKPDRKSLTVKGLALVGFGVRVSGLSPEDSLLLQKIGLGGKRKMGCGIFSPCHAHVGVES